MSIYMLRPLDDCIADAQRRFADLLACSLAQQPPSRDQYARYLSFQYHLTRDVQFYFLAVAAHRDLARRRKLREFLYHFANEEELHYLVAAKDLASLGLAPMPVCIDVELWHAYFRSVVHERPFVRLGAAAILENISAGPAREWVQKALRGDFLDRANTKFIVLHQHETLPHGAQIMEALAAADLEPRHVADLVEGAHKGTVLYLRMAEWALRSDALSRIGDASATAITAGEARRIAEFDERELEVA
jgi:hypothetical protein